MKRVLSEQLPFWVKVIAIFYFVISVFYFVFGAFVSGILFLFGRVITRGPVFLSDAVLESVFQISEDVAAVSFPYLNFFLRGNLFCIGITAFLGSGILFLIGLGLLRRIGFVRILAILFSVIEIILAFIFLYQGEILGSIIHFAFHTSMIVYLIFSKDVRRIF